VHNMLLLLIKLGNIRPKRTIVGISQLRPHMKQLTLYGIVILMIVLPFGLLLFPLYIKFLDRREIRRINT
jgi:hypothetical protein